MSARETWLELGLAGLVLALVGAAGIAVVGRAAESANRRRRNALPPPDVGALPPHSHQNIGSSAAR